MKKFLAIVTVLAVFVGTSFAYTPSTALRNKIDLASEKMMELISKRTVVYGDSVLNTIDLLRIKYQDNERASYILSALYTEIEPFMNCVSAGGTWVLGVDECEDINRVECLTMGGLFNECASACRHEEEMAACTLQCVPVCELFVDRDPGMTSNTYIIDGEEVVGTDDIYMVNSTLRSCKNDMGYMDKCYQIKPEDQIGWDLSTEGVVGLNWVEGHVYTVRVAMIDDSYTLLELLDTEVDYDVCTEISDGCNTCQIRNGAIDDCTNRSCNSFNYRADRCISTN